MTIAIVGETWGDAEEQQRMPFVGPAGYELTRQLEEVGITRGECLLTNVLNVRSGANYDLSPLCTSKRECGHNLPYIKTGKYLKAQYLPELTRLYSELAEFSPNIVIALGELAAWATLGNGSISKVRGAASLGGPLIPSAWAGGKVLATYHPATVQRDYTLRPIVLLDLYKARCESSFPEVRRPQREIIIEPGLADMEAYFAVLNQSDLLSIDIETAGDQITCFGAAASPASSIVVPFFDATTGVSHWSPAEEVQAWKWVRRVLDLPTPKVGQNFQYDMAFLWRRYGIPCRNVEHDTMLLSHALQPESPKGLAFLGSIYTNEASWKLMSHRGKQGIQTIKRED